MNTQGAQDQWRSFLDTNMQKKKAIIVGATSGIGRQLAILLANSHYIVGITGRRKNLLDELKHQQPDNFIVADFDITDTFLVGGKLDALAAQLGKVDLLILSSGTGDLNKALDFEIEKETLDLNVVGFTAVADWSINYFRQQEQGHLVAITSIAGLRGGRQAPAYNATKAFQINYLEGLRQKMTKMRLPIYITDIRPGFVDTPMAKGEGKFWVAPVEKAVAQIMTSIKRKRSVVYITKRWGIIAIIVCFLPDWMYNKL